MIWHYLEDIIGVAYPLAMTAFIIVATHRLHRLERRLERRKRRWF